MSDYDVSDRSDDDRANELFSDDEPGQRSGSDKEEDRKDDKPQKRQVKKKTGPVRHVMLAEDDLTGKNGLPKLLEIFKDFKFHGKGHEKRDLDHMLLKYEYWAHTMHPKYPFMQVVDRIEFLGMKKRPVKTMLKKIRLGMEENVVTADEHIVERGEDSGDENEDRGGGDRDGDDVPGPDDVLEDDWQAEQNDDFPDDDDDLFATIDAELEQSSKNKAEAAANKDKNTDETAATASQKKRPIIAEDSDDDDDDVNLSQARSSLKSSSLVSKRRVVESSDEEDENLLQHSQSDKASTSSKVSQSSSTQKSVSGPRNSHKLPALVESDSDDESHVTKTVSKNTENNSSSDESDYALLSHDGDSVANHRPSPKVKQTSKSKSRNTPRSSTKPNAKSSKKILKDKNNGVTKVTTNSTNASSQNKRRRIKAFEDDDEEDEVGDVSVNEDSDLEISDEETTKTSQKPGKRRRVESSSDEEAESTLNTSKEAHKRRVIVSDSEDD